MEDLKAGIGTMVKPTEGEMTLLANIDKSLAMGADTLVGVVIEAELQFSHYLGLDWSRAHGRYEAGLPIRPLHQMHGHAVVGNTQDALNRLEWLEHHALGSAVHVIGREQTQFTGHTIDVCELRR
jgi:hypothetical protein